MELLLPAVVVGYSVGLALPWRMPIWGCVGLVGAMTFVCCLRRERSSRWLAWPALFAAAGLGAGERPATAWNPDCDVGRHVSRDLTRLVVQVSDGVSRSSDGWRQGAEALWLVRRGAEPRQPVCGAVVLRWSHRAPHWHIGQRLQLLGRLKPVGPRAVGRSRAWSRWGEPTRARIFLRPGRALALGPAALSSLERFRQRIRELIARSRCTHPERAVLRALVLGERGDVSALQREHFARSGLSHLLAVSGLHLSLVAGLVFASLSWLLRRSVWLTSRWDARQWAGCAAVPVALGYAALVAESPATWRACVMACAMYLARIIGRPPDFLRPMALAALGILLLDPASLWRPAFQLSFAAVAGIALVSAKIQTGRPGKGGRVWRALRELLLVSLGATVATTPLVAYHFGTVSLLGMVANLVAVPWTAYLLLPAALGAALVGSAWTSAGLVLLRPAGWLAGGLDQLAATVAALPFSAVSLQLGRLGLGGGMLLALGLVGPRKAKRWFLIFGMCCLALELVGGLLRCAAPAGLRLSFIDVGQGDSALVEMPDGATMLVDAGGSAWSGFDPGRSYVVPYLRAAGIDRLDYVVLTHPDADHAGGLGAVLGEVAVGELWLCWHGGANPWVSRVEAWARQQHVRVVVPRVVHHGGATVRPLWPQPTAAGCADPELSTNDNSTVLQIELGGQAVVLAGDIEAGAEHQLAKNPRLRQAAVLKVPHHGSRTSSSSELLQRIHPRLAVISCGRLNRFGFPHAEVVARYRQMGATLARTDQLGALQVTLDAAGQMRSVPDLAP